MARSLYQLFFAMGGSVSPGRNNDELVNHLIDAEFIRTPAVQRVFRSVDRANYVDKDHRNSAYKDIAWKLQDLHISAPCVYSVVLESLELKPKLSFLNLGSGSGYLSTMAGLLLGQYGINHGIELHQKNVNYAYERLEAFLKEAKAIDENDFCEPEFTCGNCLTFDSNVQLYDRVYCGAACPEEYETYVKNLVKVNGILVIPLKDKLLKMTRIGENTWTSVKLLSVSFTELILPPTAEKGKDVKHAELGDLSPPTLQQLCRFQIRAYLRNNIETEHPQLKINLEERDSQSSSFQLSDIEVISDVDDSDSEVDVESFSGLIRSIYGFTSMDNANPFGLEEEEEFDVASYFKSYQDSIAPSTEATKDSSTSNSELKIAEYQDSAFNLDNYTPNIFDISSDSEDSLILEKKNNAESNSKVEKVDSNNDKNEGEAPRRENSPNLKRKGGIPENESSSSKTTSVPPPKKKVAGKSQSEEKNTFIYNIKLDENNKIREDFSYSYYITQGIASLPLSFQLLKYLNYGRDNF